MITIPVPEVDRAESSAAVARAQALTVTDAATHAAALGAIRDIALLKRGIEDRLKPAVDAAHKAHKAMTALRADLTAPLDQARDIIERKAAAYAAEARAKADAEARRLAAEAAAKAQEMQLADAVRFAAAGDDATAAAILDEPIIAPVVVVAPEVAAASAGASERKTYAAEVYDLAALVASGRAEFLLPNMPALNALARSLKGAMSIPGVRVVESVGYTVRR